MFSLSNITFSLIQLMPANQAGADYFNYFFTLIVVWALFCFGVNILVKMISRS